MKTEDMHTETTQSLTVVTITYNDHKGLVKTAKSIDDKSVEWIVIDGSNSEFQKELNADFLRSKNVIHIQEPDHGRFHAMNKGLRLASRDLVCFLNSGDQFANPDVANQIMLSWEENRWKWAVGQTICVNEDDVEQWRYPVPKHNSLKLRIGLNSYCHQATVYETSLLVQSGGYREDSLYSDWLTSLVMSARIQPFISSDLWTLFLSNGISSQQTLRYWSQESVRLRKTERIKIGGFAITDLFCQKLIEFMLRTHRGQLIRTDLDRKYPV